MSRKVTAYLGLGTNQGDRREQLKQAIHLLNNTRGIHVRQTSSIYETAPVGYLDQPPFYNMAAEIQTILSPGQLLEAFCGSNKSYTGCERSAGDRAPWIWICSFMKIA